MLHTCYTRDKTHTCAGIMLAGGSGRELAHMVVDGCSTIDMFSYDINRYHPDCVKDNAWVLGRLFCF